MALAFWQRPAIAFTVDYGQLSTRAEVRAATQVCRELSLPHEVLRVDCGSLGLGSLSVQPAVALSPTPEWWPFRNQLLITLAGMRMIALGLEELFVGSVASDAQHADGTDAFYSAVDTLAALQEGHLRVRAPALALTSVELVRVSGVPLPVLAWAHSCHRADTACGRCRGCLKHLEVFRAVGLLPPGEDEWIPPCSPGSPLG